MALCRDIVIRRIRPSERLVIHSAGWFTVRWERQKLSYEKSLYSILWNLVFILELDVTKL